MKNNHGVIINDHATWMQKALAEARTASHEGEVPVGAVVVHENILIAKAHNQMRQLNDATAHAEMIAITQAANTLGDWRLKNCTMYVTLEPCVMCAGALILSRITRVVFGTRDYRQGALLSTLNVATKMKNIHSIECIEGIAEKQCTDIIAQFFNALRTNPHA
jgi:tRNA(adenine34) deaminase